MISLFTLLACRSFKNKNKEIDNKSYINDFELLQENPKTDNIIIIKSPKAIIDPIKNDIGIYNSSIVIQNKSGQDIKVESGNSSLINSLNQIRVFNNVRISLYDTKNYFINTNSFYWDLNSSKINLDNPLDINFKNTIISSSNGTYNIKSNLLEIYNNIFNRSIFNAEGEEQYQINISSDIASWDKNNNSLEFISNNKQVETTINFLTIK